MFPQSLQPSPSHLKVPPKYSPRQQNDLTDDRKKTPSQTDKQTPKVKSAKGFPKISPTVKKMTKEEYIAHLRNKKSKLDS